jgi:hypothetical protein
MTFYVDVVFVIVDVQKTETVRFNIICQLSSIFAMKERHSSDCSIFSRHFKQLLFEYFSDRVVGTCQICSLLGIPFRRLQSYRAISTSARRHSETMTNVKKYLFSAENYLNNLRKYYA